MFGQTKSLASGQPERLFQKSLHVTAHATILPARNGAGNAEISLRMGSAWPGKREEAGQDRKQEAPGQGRRRRVAASILRPPLCLGRLEYTPEGRKAIYRGRMNPGLGRNVEVLDPKEYVNPGFQSILKAITGGQ